MDYKLIIPGRLPSLNEYTASQRGNRYKGANMKRQEQTKIEWQIKCQLRGIHIKNPVVINYEFFEPNKKRDHDNVSAFAHKVIQDALVAQKVLSDDGWDEILGYADYFMLDRKEPHITVTIQEVGKIG